MKQIIAMAYSTNFQVSYTIISPINIDSKISGSIESFTMKENHSHKMEITIPKSVIDYKDMSEEQFKTVFDYKLELK